MRHPFVSDPVAWIAFSKNSFAGTCSLAASWWLDLPNNLLSVPNRFVGRSLVTAFARRRSVEA
jgi:hypothetical protein